MDDLLHQSSWGWKQWFLPALKGQSPSKDLARYGWRYHLLRCQFIQGQISKSLWLEAENEEPDLLQLISSVYSPSSRKCLAPTGDLSPGLRADWLCDRAWDAWKDGAQKKAKRHVHEALLIMPEHAEALVWLEFLRAVQHDAAHRNPHAIDHQRLIPTQRNGWMSPERWRRRGLSGRWLCPAKRQTALYFLQERGIHTRIMGPCEWYQSQPDNHPALPIELLADRILSHIHSLRDPRPAAWSAWQQASRLGPEWVQPLASFLVQLALQNPFLIQIGVLASGILRHLHPANSCWAAAHARLLAEQGQPRKAIGLSRRVFHPKIDSKSASLIFETLIRCGHQREALRLQRLSLQAMP